MDKLKIAGSLFMYRCVNCTYVDSLVAKRVFQATKHSLGGINLNNLLM